MKAAIYTRKSKYTGKGASIENQITACKEYLKRLTIDEIFIYQDEGFSGKSTNRPKFKEMMNDAKGKKFDILICYKLDRISRNVTDFSALIDKLEKMKISFISVSENFDTTTPMGRAMMYISSVFAQLERETISERIRDNMIELSKTGRWLGGTAPLGYKSEKVSYTDADGLVRSQQKLVLVEEEIEIVKIIFTKYLELKSLSQVEKFMLQSQYQTRTKSIWSKTNIGYILKNTVYVKSSPLVVKYLEEQGSSVFGTPDGIHSLLVYNRYKDKQGEIRDISEWIYGIGLSEGVIEAEDWLKVQYTLKANTSKAPRRGKTNTALLTGLIRCAECGSYLKVKYGSPTKNGGKRKIYYSCALKYNSGLAKCQNPNADARYLEDLVINELKNICCDTGLLVTRLKQYKQEMRNTLPDDEIKLTKDAIARCNTSITNIMSSLALTNDEATKKTIIETVEGINLEKSMYEKKLQELYNHDEILNQYEKNLDILIDSYFNFSNMIDISSHEHKKMLIASVVEKIIWDGRTKNVKLKIKGVN